MLFLRLEVQDISGSESFKIFSAYIFELSHVKINQRQPNRTTTPELAPTTLSYILPFHTVL
jgi:hypothetical protein